MVEWCGVCVDDFDEDFWVFVVEELEVGSVV